MEENEAEDNKAKINSNQYANVPGGTFSVEP